MKLPAIVASVPAFVSDFGGPYVSKGGMAKALASKGCDVTLLTTDIASVDGTRVSRERHEAQQLEWQQCGVRLIRVPYTWHYRWATVSAAAPRIVWGAIRRARELDRGVLVHIAGYREGLGTTTSVLAHVAGIPVVWEPMGMARAAGRSMIKKRLVDQSIGRLTLRRADRIVATSPVERDDVLGLGVQPSQIFVRANGLEPVPRWMQNGTPASWKIAARQRLGLNPDERIVLYLGRITERKGLVLIAEAMRETAGRFFVVGPDEQDGTWPRIQAILGARAVMPGAVSGEAKWDWLAAADVFALAPTHGENFAMSALEAAAAGTPLLLSPAVGFGGLMPQGVGHIIPLHVALWTQALQQSSVKADLQVVTRVRQQFSWSGIADKQLTLYNELLAERV